MTRDDVVRMAHECDIHVSEGNTFADDCYISVLYRFANKAIQAAVEAEREACAEIAASTVCDEHIPTGIKIYGTRAAKAIRARGEK